MKKNKMLRMASVLLVMTLLTTSVIGGTFAKYVTSDSSSDTARVAKFGVVASVSGDLFGSTYADNAGGNTIISYSVNGGTVSAGTSTDKVVAPGTKNEKGLTLSVTGTPEVSTKVTLGSAKTDADAEYADSDIYLATGDYGVMVQYTGELTKENIVNYYTLTNGTYTKATAETALTTQVYELHDEVSVTAAYYPLQWKVDNGAAIAKVADVKAQLVTKFQGKTFAPNKDNTLSAKVTWEWPFGNGTNDKQDTILGDMIAAKLAANSIAVVKKDGDTYATVQYTDITSGASTIEVAYTGSTVPTELSSTDICACLTVAFNASLTVAQEN